MKNVANTNVGVFGDHLLAYFEGGLPYALDPENLATIGPHDFHGGIDVVCTAHYKLDPATGDIPRPQAPLRLLRHHPRPAPATS